LWWLADRLPPRLYCSQGNLKAQDLNSTSCTLILHIVISLRSSLLSLLKVAPKHGWSPYLDEGFKLKFCMRRYYANLISGLSSTTKAEAMVFHKHVVLLTFTSALLHLVLAGDSESITMPEAPGYTNLRGCAKYCFQSNGYGNVQAALSCDQNTCLVSWSFSLCSRRQWTLIRLR
jgi:hypothetical protein